MTALQTQNPGASPSGASRSDGRLAIPTNWHARDKPAARCRRSSRDYLPSFHTVKPNDYTEAYEHYHSPS